jgi:hypothetical protein
MARMSCCTRAAPSGTAGRPEPVAPGRGVGQLEDGETGTVRRGGGVHPSQRTLSCAPARSPAVARQALAAPPTLGLARASRRRSRCGATRRPLRWRSRGGPAQGHGHRPSASGGSWGRARRLQRRRSGGTAPGGPLREWPCSWGCRPSSGPPPRRVRAHVLRGWQGAPLPRCKGQAGERLRRQGCRARVPAVWEGAGWALRAQQRDLAAPRCRGGGAWKRGSRGHGIPSLRALRTWPCCALRRWVRRSAATRAKIRPRPCAAGPLFARSARTCVGGSLMSRRDHRETVRGSAERRLSGAGHVTAPARRAQRSAP